MSAKPYKTKEEYRQVREAVFRYWGFSNCIVLGCANEDVKLHHFVPRRAGGDESPENLIPICPFHENPLHVAGQYARTGQLPNPKTVVALTKNHPGHPEFVPKRKRQVEAKEWTGAPRLRPVKCSGAKLVWGCSDCVFQFEEKPPYCGTCKQQVSQCIKADSLTLKGYYVPGRIESTDAYQAAVDANYEKYAVNRASNPSKSTGLEPTPTLTMDEEHAAFHAYLRKRSKKHGKKDHAYRYGKDLATNMAAPFIVRLRAEAERQAKVPETGGARRYNPAQHLGEMFP